MESRRIVEMCKAFKPVLGDVEVIIVDTEVQRE
jgi:hypothetical protein